MKRNKILTNRLFNKPMSYERAIYLFLSLYRFFTFGLAVALIQARVVGTSVELDRETYIVLSVVSVYTLLKVFSPLRWHQRDRMAYVVLGGDIFLCIFLLMFTSGLDSGFLLYVLTPIITAAVLFEAWIALTAAGLISVSLLVVHIGVSPWSSKYAWIMDGNYLPLLVVYIIFCFLIVILSYRTNLNISQRIEMEAVLNERGRIRRELHDGVAQALSYLNMKATLVRNALSSQNADKALAGLEDIQKTVRDTLEDVRQSIDALSERNAFPLIPTLAEYIQDFGKRNGIKISFESPPSLPGLSIGFEFQLLRIVHEALNNVRKHAQATEVWVSVVNSPHKVEMMIKDNGQGFSLQDSERASEGHHGLNIMRERVEGMGGTFAIVTSPGQGMEIRVNIPVGKVRL